MTEMFGEAWPPMSVPDLAPDDDDDDWQVTVVSVSGDSQQLSSHGLEKILCVVGVQVHMSDAVDIVFVLFLPQQVPSLERCTRGE